MTIAIEYVPIGSLQVAPYNPRKMPDEQMRRLMRGIEEYGVVDPIIVNRTTGNIVGGHQRAEAARRLGLTEVPIVEVALDLEREKALNLALNKISGDWSLDLLSGVLGDLDAAGFDMELTGFSADEIAGLLENGTGGGSAGSGTAPSLADRFGVPPFTVLDARQGYWQERKRYWIGMGIRSELGRGEDASPGGSARPAMKLDESGRTARGDGAGRRLTYVEGSRPVEEMDEVSRKIVENQSGTSIFDPVLCEVAYRWFSPPGGTILDPFAGGSVRGIVAARLGRQYVGMELRAEQVEANREQWAAIGSQGDSAPDWHIGDSRSIASLIGSVKADLIFSCPPYADLEVYSDDPADLSTMSYPDFLAAYRAIIAASVSMLHPNRFACFVVGDIRDRKGYYRNFVSDTIAAFQDAGAKLYNEAILITAIGSLALRAGRQFDASRKMGKTHQNVLVFCKGDPKKATQACGAIEIVIPDSETGLE